MSGITAIMPAFNEEVSIGSMVLRTKQYADHVIVIDDGSRDHTAEVAEMAGAEVIRHTKNMGKGAALKTGFDAALDADIIVTIDSDGQHNPAEIPKLVAPILAGEADIVNGSRYINGRKTSTPTYRRAGQIVLDKVTNMDCGLAITDTQSGFRAFAAHTVDAFRFLENGLAIESEMLADAARAGFRIREVEIGVRYDVNCSKKHPLSHGLGIMANVLSHIELKRPLSCFTVPGVLLGGIGLCMGIYFVNNYINGEPLHFGPSLMMTLFIITGSFMALTGVILHSISRMISELKEELVPLRMRANNAYINSRAPALYVNNAVPEKENMAFRIEKA